MWVSDWGPEAKYAYKVGIAKGRKLEYEEQQQRQQEQQPMGHHQHDAQTKTERLINAVEALTVQIEKMTNIIQEDEEEVITAGPDKTEILLKLQDAVERLETEGMIFTADAVEKAIKFIKENVND